MIKSLLINNSLLIIHFAVTGLVPILLIPHFIRTIGLDLYGEIAIGLSFSAYASIIVQYSFDLSGPRFLAEVDSEIKKKEVFFCVIFLMLLIFYIVSLIFALLVYFLSQKIELKKMILYLFLPAGTVFDSSWYLQYVNRFSVITFVSIVSIAFSFFVGFGFVLSPDDDLLALFSLTLGSVLSGFGTFAAAIYIQKSEKLKIDWSKIFKYLREGRSVFFSQFIASLYAFSGPVIVGSFVSSSAAGAYSAIERIVRGVTGLCQLTHAAAYPRLTRLYSCDKVSYSRLLKFVIGLYFVSASLFLIFVTLFKGEVVGFVLGEGSDIYGHLLWWGVLLVFLGIAGPVITGYYIVSGQDKEVYRLTMKVLFLSLGLGIPGVNIFGPWAFFGALAAAQIFVLWEGWRVFKV